MCLFFTFRAVFSLSRQLLVIPILVVRTLTRLCSITLRKSSRERQRRICLGTLEPYDAFARLANVRSELFQVLLLHPLRSTPCLRARTSNLRLRGPVSRS